MVDKFSATDLKKIFKEWSRGTLYNRLERLNIRGNPIYVISSSDKTILYNLSAVELLKEQYLKEKKITLEEFDNNLSTLTDYQIFTEATRSVKIDNQSVKSDEKNVKSSVNVDKLSDNLSTMDLSYLTENFVDKKIHEEIVDNLKCQIDILKRQLENVTTQNAELTKTIKLREQKEIVVEQQKLVKLQKEDNKIEALGTAEDNKKGWFFNFFRRK